VLILFICSGGQFASSIEKQQRQYVTHSRPDAARIQTHDQGVHRRNYSDSPEHCERAEMNSECQRSLEAPGGLAGLSAESWARRVLGASKSHVWGIAQR
jgi:hypothetical protein